MIIVAVHIRFFLVEPATFMMPKRDIGIIDSVGVVCSIVVGHGVNVLVQLLGQTVRNFMKFGQNQKDIKKYIYFYFFLIHYCLYSFSLYIISRKIYL